MSKPKPIVILHGWGNLIKQWQPIKQALNKKGYQVYIPCLPGFYGQKIPRPFNTQDYVNWLSQYLKLKKINKLYLVGHSFGGQISIAFTKHYPQKVSKLILINSSGIRKRFVLKRILFLPIAKLGKLIFSFSLFKEFANPVRELLYKAACESDYLKSSTNLKKTLINVIKEDQKQNLSQIKTPSLIIWGQKDNITPLSQGKKIHQLLSNSILKIFPYTSHGLPFQQPDKLTQKILWFISLK